MRGRSETNRIIVLLNAHLSVFPLCLDLRTREVWSPSHCPSLSLLRCTSSWGTFQELIWLVYWKVKKEMRSISAMMRRENGGGGGTRERWRWKKRVVPFFWTCAFVTGSVLPDEHIVVTSHHDHLGMGPPDEEGDTIYNGGNFSNVFHEWCQALLSSYSFLLLHLCVFSSWGQCFWLCNDVGNDYSTNPQKR